jgi:hypothetical protein
MTDFEVAEALDSIATTSKTRPLLEMWKTQCPVFQIQDQDNSAKTVQADPPFWKMVVDTWADDFLFRAYVQQERK